MIIPCKQTINPKSYVYRCRVSGNENPICFDCVVYKTFEAHDETIQGLKNEVLKYKNKSDKYDEIVKAYTDQLVKTVARAFINTLDND